MPKNETIVNSIKSEIFKCKKKKKCYKMPVRNIKTIYMYIKICNQYASTQSTESYWKNKGYIKLQEEIDINNYDKNIC